MKLVTFCKIFIVLLMILVKVAIHILFMLLKILVKLLVKFSTFLSIQNHYEKELKEHQKVLGVTKVIVNSLSDNVNLTRGKKRVIEIDPGRKNIVYCVELEFSSNSDVTLWRIGTKYSSRCFSLTNSEGIYIFFTV